MTRVTPWSRRVEGTQGLPAQAVAVLHPAGDVFQAVRSPGAEVVHQQHGGGDAVHVVVAEDGHPLAVRQGAADTGGGLVHVLHEIGGVAQLPLPVQEQGGLLRGGYAPCGEQGGQEGGVARSPEAPGSGLVVVPAGPSGIFHCSSLLLRPPAGAVRLKSRDIIAKKEEKVKTQKEALPLF
jgi:hypothetical protein